MFNQIPLSAPNTSPVIAPLWIDTFIGQMTFSNTLHYRVSSNNETLSLIAAILMEQNSNLTDYLPRTAVIATWFFNPDSEVT